MGGGRKGGGVSSQQICPPKGIENLLNNHVRCSPLRNWCIKSCGLSCAQRTLHGTWTESHVGKWRFHFKHAMLNFHLRSFSSFSVLIIKYSDYSTCRTVYKGEIVHLTDCPCSAKGGSHPNLYTGFIQQCTCSEDLRAVEYKWRPSPLFIHAFSMWNGEEKERGRLQNRPLAIGKNKFIQDIKLLAWELKTQTDFK